MKRTINKTWVVVLVLVMAMSVTAFAKDEVAVKVTNPLVLNGSQINAGEYKISWTAQGAETKVTFTRGSKVVAATSAKLVQRNVKYTDNELVFNSNADGSKTLLEVRIGRTNEALVFSE